MPLGWNRAVVVVLRWKTARLIDSYGFRASFVAFLVFVAAAIACAVVFYEAPRAAHLAGELQSLRSPAVSNSSTVISVTSPSTAVASQSYAPDLMVHAGLAAKSAGLNSIKISADPIATDKRASAVSLQARGTYAECKSLLTALLYEKEVAVTDLELRVIDAAQVEMRVNVVVAPVADPK